MCVYCGGQHRPLSLDHFNKLSFTTTQTIETRSSAPATTWSSPAAAPAAAGGLPNLVETTDAAANASTAYALGVGQSVRGQVGFVGDTDWFAVNLSAGQTYTFAMVGTGSFNVQDTYLRLYAVNGTTLLAHNDDGLQSHNSIFTYTAPTSGTYYIAASAFDNSGTGQYGVSVAAGGRASFDIAMGAGVIDTDQSWSAPGAGATITYGFRANTNGNAPNFSLLTAAEIAAVRSSLQQYSEVANLTFTEVNPGGYTNNATMLFANYFSSTDGFGAYAYYPGSTAATAHEGDVWFNTNSVSTTSLPFGSWSYITVLHEIGHALGLSHPGVYNAAPGQTITYAANAQFVEDTEHFTVMSYFAETNTGADHGGWADTLMMFDIQAVQAIYGANMTTRTGNTVYGFGSNAGSVYDFAINTTPAVCIWDAGGTDTLNCSGFGQNQTINLTAGQFSQVGGLSSNVSIALGAVIENAKGGGGSDSINGNDFANDLQGNGGNDTLKGAGGADRLTGGAGSDNLVGGTGTDVAVFSGARSSYQITRNTDNSIRVSDLRQGAPDGIDLLYDVEQGSFADGVFDLSAPTGAAEITILGNGTSIADGDTTPGAGDHTDFGSVTQGGAALVRTFTVRNDGTANLTLSAPVLPTGFTLVEGLSASLAPGASDTFQVRLNSGTAGTWAGDISITNNDGNESPFNFRITGTVNTAPGGGGAVPSLGDVLWQHTDGTIRTAGTTFGAVSGAWQIRGTADFNGDGDADILWRHQDGSVALWELQNGQFHASRSIAFASTAWDIVNSGDFDGDGDADILWRHQDGTVVTWEMENGAYLTNHNIAFAPANWTIDGLGDFDGDGDDDIIWRHRDGAVVTWEMENGAYLTNHNLALAPANWRVIATADFDADGDDDILWRHSGGTAVAWEMENGNYVVNHNLPFMDPAWRIAGAEDFDSDGDGDILWRHTNGDVMTWAMQNGTLVQANNLGVFSNAWQIRGTGEFDMA